MEPGTEVSANFLFPYHPRPLLSLPLFPTLPSYTLCDVCILFSPLPFFSIQTDSQGTSSETQNLSPSGFLWRTFLCLATTFLWHNPATQLSEATGSLCFDFPAVFFGFITQSFITRAHIFIELFPLAETAVKGQ